MEKERLTFSYGRQHGQQIIIEVDGAWKQVKKKKTTRAGIGGLREQNQ